MDRVLTRPEAGPAGCGQRLRGPVAGAPCHGCSHVWCGWGTTGALARRYQQASLCCEVEDVLLIPRARRSPPATPPHPRPALAATIATTGVDAVVDAISADAADAGAVTAPSELERQQGLVAWAQAQARPTVALGVPSGLDWNTGATQRAASPPLPQRSGVGWPCWHLHMHTARMAARYVGPSLFSRCWTQATWWFRREARCCQRGRCASDCHAQVPPPPRGRSEPGSSSCWMLDCPRKRCSTFGRSTARHSRTSTWWRSHQAKPAQHSCTACPRSPRVQSRIHAPCATHPTQLPRFGSSRTRTRNQQQRIL